MATEGLILVTGASSGLGRAFAQHALASGRLVLGTVRRQADAEAFERLAPGHAHARLLDVTDTAAIDPMVAEVEAASVRWRCW